MEQTKVSKFVGIVFFFLIVLIAIVITLGYVLGWEWVGVLNYDKIKFRTFWDWMELIIIPLTLATAAFLLSRWQANIERKSTLDNQRQSLLDSYIDKISELLLEKSLRQSEDNEVSSIARTRTLLLFRQLDGDRKGNALQFLFESGLISGTKPVVPILGLDLDTAYLGGATLMGVNLSGISCKNTNLRDANLRDAILTGCIFTKSDMQGADFTNASLNQAILAGCNLSNADFTGTNLNMADLRGALVTSTQLEKAKSLDYALLPDGNVYQPKKGGSK